MNDITDTYKDINLTDLVNDCNAGNIQSLYLKGNFNEIETGTPSERRAGTCEGNPNKLYNNFSDLVKKKAKELRMAIEKESIRESPLNKRKLYNKIPESGTCGNGFQYKSKIETPHGTIYFEGEPNIVLVGETLPGMDWERGERRPSARSKEETKAL